MELEDVIGTTLGILLLLMAIIGIFSLVFTQSLWPQKDWQCTVWLDTNKGSHPANEKCRQWTYHEQNAGGK